MALPFEVAERAIEHDPVVEEDAHHDHRAPRDHVLVAVAAGIAVVDAPVERAVGVAERRRHRGARQARVDEHRLESLDVRGRPARVGRLDDLGGLHQLVGVEAGVERRGAAARHLGQVFPGVEDLDGLLRVARVLRDDPHQRLQVGGVGVRFEFGGVHAAVAADLRPGRVAAHGVGRAGERIGAQLLIRGRPRLDAGGDQVAHAIHVRSLVEAARMNEGVRIARRDRRAARGRAASARGAAPAGRTGRAAGHARAAPGSGRTRATAGSGRARRPPHRRRPRCPSRRRAPPPPSRPRFRRRSPLLSSRRTRRPAAPRRPRAAARPDPCPEVSARCEAGSEKCAPR